MKAAFVLAAAASGLVAAQNLSGQPTCATSCLSSAITAAGCAPTDQACQCGDRKNAIGGLAAPCLLGACGAGDLAAAASVGDRLCAEFSAARTGAATTTTTTGSSGSGSATPTATTTSSSSSGTGSETASGSTTTTTTGGGAAGNTTITSGGSTITKETGGGGSTTKTTGGGGSSTAGTTTAPTNAAAQPVIWGAGAFVALMGAIAAL